MDLFVYSNYTVDAKGMVDYPYSTLEGALLIPDIISVMWVERYLEPGEFSFTVPQDSNARSMVPLGSIISQVEGQETMIVENHEINEDKDGEMIVTISGRSFQVYLENRGIGQDGVTFQTNIGTGISFPNISLVAGERWGAFGGRYWVGNSYAPGGGSGGTVLGNFQRKTDVVEFLVNRLLGTREAVYPNQNPALPQFSLPPTTQYSTPFTPYSVPNADTVNFIVFINYNNKPVPQLDPNYFLDIQSTDAHTAIVEILATESMGIKTQRAGLTSPIDFAGQGIPHNWPAEYKNKLAMVVYYANDRREAVQFSYAGGDINSANYLWSIKNAKNSYWARGDKRGLLYRGEKGYKQRTMFVDASDFDEGQVDSPLSMPTALTEAQALATLQSFREWGNKALANPDNQETKVMEAKLVSQQSDLIYRRDYDTGDLVTVMGNYGFKETMQIAEYVEIEDENGETSYPTLIIPTQKVIDDLSKPVGQRI